MSVFGLALLLACSASHSHSNAPQSSSPSPSTSSPPVLQGTADGSGADIRKSSFAQIDKTLFDPSAPHLDLHHRLRLLFHRLQFLRQKPKKAEAARVHILKNEEDELVHAYLTKYTGSPDDEVDPPAWKVLDRIFAPHTKTLDEDLQALQLHVQDPPCLSIDGRKAVMAIKDHTVCISREQLSLTAPEGLLLQTLAVGAHEVAHLRGITSEEDAELVRNYVLDNERFLIEGDSLSGIVELQEQVSDLMLSSAVRDPDDRVLQKEYRCTKLLSTLEHLGNLPGVLIGLELRDLIEQTLTANCMGIDQTTLPRQAHDQSVQGRKEVLAIQDAALTMAQTLEKRRRQFMAILSPFYSWHYLNYPARTADEILLANALRPLLDKKGMWQPKLSSEQGLRQRQQLSCSLDGRALTFSAAQCPALQDGESYPHVVRDNSFIDKTCAVGRARDSRGFEHQILFIDGPATMNSDADMTFSQMHDKELPDLVYLQILLNVNLSSENFRKEDWRQGFQGGKFIAKISGQDLMSAANNVAAVHISFDTFTPFYLNPMSSGGVNAVLHPKTAPQIDFQLQLPAAYDEFSENIRFDDGGPHIRCQLKPLTP